MLDEVVVTALGIKRKKKALGYAMQEVKTDVFSENRSSSVSNLLQGKVAGVQISQSGSGVGGPIRFESTKRCNRYYNEKGQGRKTAIGIQRLCVYDQSL